jgi:hypothetical protein
MELASTALIAEIHNLQRDIQVDDAANIQFTSVINIIVLFFLLSLIKSVFS